MSHNILQSKLDHFVIRGSTHKLMQLFLNTKQFVRFNGIKSAIECVTYGVTLLLGSTLSPLLFLLYINDLPCSTNCLSPLLAENICLAIIDTELNTQKNVINKEIATFYNWLQANKLNLNLAKSNYLIAPAKMHAKSSHICLNLNDTEIPYFNHAEYLVVHINPHLNF